MTRTVQQTFELDTLFSNLSELFQAPHLESAAVRQHRTVPAHELLHAPRFGNEFRPRPQVEMVSIRKDNLSIKFANVATR